MVELVRVENMLWGVSGNKAREEPLGLFYSKIRHLQCDSTSGTGLCLFCSLQDPQWPGGCRRRVLRLRSWRICVFILCCCNKMPEYLGMLKYLL
jgi:hypothetical protein